SCLDFGEEGLVGRGNRPLTGVAATQRIGSVEAAGGKNPVYHAGKVLGLAADEISAAVGHFTGFAREGIIGAKRGNPLMTPSEVGVSIDGAADELGIVDIVRQQLARTDLTKMIVEEEALIPRTGNVVLKRFDNRHFG